MATMYDSVSAQALPATTTLALGYVDMGYRADYGQTVLRFPHATVVSVTASIQGLAGARVYDCERGDGNAVSAASWAKRELNAGRRPTIYCSRIGSPGYGWPDVQKALIGAGVQLNQVDFGIADYTGVKHVVAGSVFTQWANPTYTHADYDISETNGVWPNQLAPQPQPIHQEDSMDIYSVNDGAGYVIASDLTTKRLIPDAADGAALSQSGNYLIKNLTDELVKAIPSL